MGIRWARGAATVAGLVGTALTLTLAGCGGAAGGSSGRTLQVLAAENFWGSLAAQLGGARVRVTSIVTNPNADPHEYESSVQDARAFAGADYVILNGAGYDDWARRLLGANPNPARRVFTVADLVGVREGDNPHIWYNPSWVDRVADRITADYRAIDPAGAAAFDQQRARLNTGLQPYHDEVASLHGRYGGVKVGSTEGIVVYLGQALGLDLISPPRFMQAISQGNDPAAQDVATFNAQIDERAIAVLFYNTQTATAVTTNLRHRAVEKGIPVVGITETLTPPGATFQEWQVAQLRALSNALADAVPP